MAASLRIQQRSGEAGQGGGQAPEPAFCPRKGKEAARFVPVEAHGTPSSAVGRGPTPGGSLCWVGSAPSDPDWISQR